jgi:hypothetical protein
MGKSNLPIKQGATFTAVFRWEESTPSYAVIDSITKAAPAVATTNAVHGIADGWPRVWIMSCKGMTEINAPSADPKEAPVDLREDEAHKVVVPSTTTVKFPLINSTQFGTYSGSGVLAWYPSKDLANHTAHMQIRDSVEASAYLLELTTNPAPGGGAGNGRIVIDNTAKTITTTLTAAETAAITTWDRAVYDLELVSASGVVTRIAWGNVTVSKEATR